MQYADTYQRSISDPEAFWAERAKDIPWYAAPQNMLRNDAIGGARGFAEGRL